MGSNYGFSDWLADMQYMVENGISALPWRLLTVAAFLFVLSVICSLYLLILRSLTFDIADKDDIIQDRRNCPNSWFFGEDYEKVNTEMKKSVIRSYMLKANLGYYTFWNVVIMGYYRLCGTPRNKIYFRVNRFTDRHWDIFASIKQLFTVYSLMFIWGYPVFLVITLIRMKFHKDPLC